MRGITLSALVLAAALAVSLGSSGAEPEPPLSGQDAFKLAKVREVAAELASRDTSQLTAEQRTRRAALIQELRAYADRGRFAQNNSHPGHAIPSLIDDQGTRCALANLIDFSGHDKLLARLARDHNHDFIRSLVDDREFTAWIDRHGLTLEEATYIMGPGYVMPEVNPARTEPVSPAPDREPADPEDEPTADPEDVPEADPEDVEGPTTENPDVGDPEGGTTPRAPERAGGPAPRVTRPDGTRKRGAVAANTWTRWWALNRNAFLNLRRRYHDERTDVTPRESAFKGFRASDTEITSGLIPFFKGIALEPNNRTRATALAAWARAARPAHASDLGAALRAYLRDGNNAFRELIIMKFGTVKHVTTQPALREILLDTKEGRRLLGTQGAITQQMRAFAAIALGHTGRAESVDTLMQVLAQKGKAMPDLRAACILATGVLGRTGDELQRGRVIRFLVKHLRERRWPDQALCMIPTALAATGDVTVIGELQETLTKFRKPRVVRQSCALAIAALAPKLTEPLIDTLIGNARRDPDDTVRRFALVALGQIAERHPRKPEAGERDAKLAGKLDRFYAGCFKGINLQKQDLPWLYFSVALYGRNFDDRANDMADRLLHEVHHTAAADRRCAALVSLGLLGNPRAVAPVRKVLTKAKDIRTRASAAETLGLLGDRTSQLMLRGLATTSGSDLVRYGAAIGLGFLADSSSLEMLLETFQNTGSHAAQATLARVIGEIGDRRAIPPLMEIASNKKADHWTRRRALAALGMIGQPEDEATVTRYQKAVNYEQATPSLKIVLSLF